ncbi:MAG: tetratricopeptide repeat protein [Saprospiraceae bacterium]
MPAVISLLVAFISYCATYQQTEGQIKIAKEEIKKEIDLINLTFTQETVRKLVDKEVNIVDLRKKLNFYLESNIIQDTSFKIKQASSILIDETVALEKFMDGYDLINEAEIMRNKKCSLKDINGQYKKALKILTESIELNPFNGQAYISRNICYRQLGLQYASEPYFYLRALDDSKKALEYYGEPSYPLYYIGKNYRNLEKLDSALIYYDSSIESNANIGRYYFSRGIVKLQIDSKKEDTLDIIEDLEKSLLIGNISKSQESEAKAFIKRLKNEN